MPYGDHTGPFGEGPKTGRGLGYCSGNDRPGAEVGKGRGMGRGAVRGKGNGRGRGLRRGRGRGLGRGFNNFENEE